MEEPGASCYAAGMLENLLIAVGALLAVFPIAVAMQPGEFTLTRSLDMAGAGTK